MRRGAKPAKAKVEVEQAVTGKSSKHESSRVRDLERHLAEAQEQERATSEILRVIASSPTDVQPVFDTIVRNARGLCGADSAGVLTYDGVMVRRDGTD
jgi:hypothetical protein